MKLTWEVVTIHTKAPFVIARGGATEYRVVRVCLRDDGELEGWGEAAPNRFYGETADTALGALEALAPVVESVDPFALESLEAAMNGAIRLNGSAKSAISAAAHDLVCRKLQIPLYRLWGLEPARAPFSSFTIGIAPDHETLRLRVEEAEEYPILKVKLGTVRDAEIMRVVRGRAPGKTIRVDANAAWTPKVAVERIAMLVDHGVEYVEQPVAAHDLDGMAFVRERSSLPIIADESCVVASDIPRLAGRVDGINIKLSKCGGLREALRMIHTARAHSMLVMLGCMVETSLGIAPAAHMASLVDCADLDGAALLADDPYSGPTIHGGRIRLPDADGLGVTYATAG